MNIGPGRSYIEGDLNLDTFVDGFDFILWNANKFSDTGLWSLGDVNADSFTDGFDFIIWNANKFTSSDNQVVPEPTCWMLALAGLVGWKRNRAGLKLLSNSSGR